LRGLSQGSFLTTDVKTPATADDFYNAPEQILARVRAALIERGATGIRRQFKTEWQRYFTAFSLPSNRFGGCDEKRAERAGVSGPS
jgi:hypothetical protein